MSPYIKNVCNHLCSKLSPKQKQWCWFIGLWIGGFLTITLVGWLIKRAMLIG